MILCAVLVLLVKWMDDLQPSIFVMPVIALAIVIILYVRFLKKAASRLIFKKFILTAFTLVFIMNLAWELLHGPLYKDYTFETKMISFCALASVADAVMVLLLYFIFALIYKDPFWIADLSFKSGFFLMIVGGIGAVLAEIRHTSEGNWAYDESMPIIPFVGAGLSPVLQFILLPLLIYYLSFYLIKKKMRKQF